MQKNVKRTKYTWKKVAAMAVCLGVVCGTLGGCSSDQPTTANSSGGSTGSTGSSGAPVTPTEAAFTRDENGYPDLKGEAFDIWFSLTSTQSKFTTDLGEYNVIQQLEKDFNCTINFSHPPVGQERDNFSIMMAGGDWPDMIFSGGIGNYPGGISAALADKVMYDVTPYINEVNTPNFMEKVMSDETMKRWFTDDEGRVTKLGSKIMGSEEADIDFSGPLVRKDYLEATGMDTPVTVDDWYQMLTKMKSNGVEYPLALSGSGWKIDQSCNLVSSAYGISLDFFVKEDDKTVSHGKAEPAYKDYLTTMNKWYTEQLINPDFPTQTMEDTSSLLASGKSGAMVMHLMDYTTKYFVTNEKANPDQGMIPVQYPVLKEGDALSRVRPSSRGVGDDKVITTTAKNPLACIYLLDALYIDSITHRNAYGTEGVTYDVINGMPITRPLTDSTPKDVQLQGFPGQWHTTEDDVLAGVLLKYNVGCDEAAIRLWGECSTDGNLPTSFMSQKTEESEINSKYLTDLNTYMEEMCLKFITGVEPLTKFDAYLEQLKAMHIDELISVRQDQFDRYNAR